MHSWHLAVRRPAGLRGSSGRVQLRRKLWKRRISLPDREMVYTLDVALQRGRRMRERRGRKFVRLRPRSIQVSNRGMRA